MGLSFKGDWIIVMKLVDIECKYISYKYVWDGFFVKIEMFFDLGEYELCYVLDGKKVVVRRLIVILDVIVIIILLLFVVVLI